jgi:hypothetical protein
MRGKKGKMTNREYLNSLSNMDFANFIYSKLLKIGKEYNDSVLGIAHWLGKENNMQLPSAERKGQWVETTVRGSTALCCSYCGQESGVLYRYNYCPNCGAKMEVVG